MISFKNYIKEDLLKYSDEAGYHAGGVDYDEKRFASPVFLIWSSIVQDDYIAIPLYGSIIERIEKKMKDKAPLRKDVVGLHVASAYHYDDLKKLQKGRKPISAATQLDRNSWGSFLYDGVTGHAGTVYMVRGDLAARFFGDAFTELDKNGKRWVDFYSIIARIDEKFVPMHKILQSIRAKTKKFIGNLLDIDEDMFRSYFNKSDKEKKRDTQIEEILRSTTNEEKSEIVKFYYDLCSEEMAENAELFASAFFHPEENLRDAYDEALLYNFEIEKVFISVEATLNWALSGGMEYIKDAAKKLERDGVDYAIIDDLEGNTEDIDQILGDLPFISIEQYREAIEEHLV